MSVSIYTIGHYINSHILAFGTGSDFVWSNAGDYAVREQYTVKIFKGTTNNQHISLKTDFPIEGLSGGPVL